MKILVLLLSTVFFVNSISIEQSVSKTISEEAIERMPDGKKTVIENEYSLMSDDLADDT